MLVVVLSLSVTLQLLAAGLALRLIRWTGRRLVWGLIATAITLMALRRAVTLAELPVQLAEWVALLISILLVAGLWGIGPMFSRMQRTEQSLHLGVVPVVFDDAIARVLLQSFGARIAPQQSHARLRIAGEAHFEGAHPLNLAVHAIDRPAQQQPTAFDDADAGAAVGQLGQNVARNQNRLAHFAQLLEQRLDL